MNQTKTHDEPTRQRAVFWDRDGTLMHEVGYCSRITDVKTIPGIADTLRTLRELGLLNIIITNQSGIHRGYLSVEEYEAVNEELFRQLNFRPDAVYYCPDLPQTISRRRKPAPGMIEEACKEFHIDPAKSWMIGDKESDILCGRTAGCRTILVHTGYGKNCPSSLADYTATSAAEIAEIILAETTRPNPVKGA